MQRESFKWQLRLQTLLEVVAQWCVRAELKIQGLFSSLHYIELSGLSGNQLWPGFMIVLSLRAFFILKKKLQLQAELNH